MTEYRYQFINAETGRVCCGSDSNDPMYFCSKCKPKLAALSHSTSRAAARGVSFDGTVFRTTAANPYAPAMNSRENERREALTNPELWPDYHPHGNPPDGYSLHLAMRHLDAEDDKEQQR
jgi:hypothetical protein